MGLCPTLRMTQKNQVSAVVPLLCTSQCECLSECSYLLLNCYNRRVCLSLVTSGGCFEQRACSMSFLPQPVEHRLTSTDRLIIFSWLGPRTGKYTRYVFGGWDCCTVVARGEDRRRVSTEPQVNNQTVGACQCSVGFVSPETVLVEVTQELYKKIELIPL